MPGGHPIPYEAFPDVNPTGAPQGDFENIHASPEEFGGLVAGSEEKLGKGVEDVGTTGLQVATDYQQRSDDIHATDLNTWAGKNLSDRFLQIKQLQGRAASDALPQYKTDIDDIRQQAMNQATNLYEKQKLSQSLSYLTDAYYRYGTSHAADQMTAYASKTANDAASNYGNLAGITYQTGDWAGFQRNLNNQDMEGRNYLEHQGYDPTTIETEVTKNRGKTLRDIIESQAASDPNAASLLFQKYATQMDPLNRLAVMNKLTPILRQQGFEVAGNALLGRVPPQDAFSHGETSAGLPTGYTAKVISIESNWDPNAASPSGTYRGLGQFGPTEAKKYGITDPGDVAQTSNALLSEAQDNKPVLANALSRNPTAGELYLAHQQGAAGAAALLANPDKPAWEAIRKFYGSDAVAQQAIWGNMPASMKAQFPDGVQSVPAAAFSQMWTGRYQRAGVDVPIIDKGQAYQRMEALYGNNPVMRNGVKSVIDREYNLQEVESSQRRGELEAQVPGLIQDVRDGNVEKALPPDVALLGPVAASRIQSEWNSAYREGQARRGMVYASPDEINDLRTSLVKGPGDDEFRRQDLGAFDRAVGERDKLIFGNPEAAEEGKRRGDPAAYAQTYPTVATLKEQSKANPQDADAFQKYATSSLALQDHLGVPKADQHILNRSESEAVVKQITTPGADVKGILDRAKQQAGDHYQDVYHDLVTQGGLGASYQLVGALDDKNAGVLSRWLQGLAPKEDGKASTADEILGISGGKNNATQVRSDILSNTALTDLQHSWGDSGFSADAIKGLTGAVEDLAYGKMLYEHLSPTSAAGQAVEAVTGKYTIWSGEGSARVPIENNATVRANAAKTLDNLKEEDLSIPGVIGADRQLGAARGADYLRLLKASPYWVTSSDGKGIILKDSYLTGSIGRVVNDKAGKPIYIPFDAPLMADAKLPAPDAATVAGAGTSGG